MRTKEPELEDGPPFRSRLPEVAVLCSLGLASCACCQATWHLDRHRADLLTSARLHLQAHHICTVCYTLSIGMTVVCLRMQAVARPGIRGIKRSMGHGQACKAIVCTLGIHPRDFTGSQRSGGLHVVNHESTDSRDFAKSGEVPCTTCSSPGPARH